jgi:predicted dehydrogenase
MSRRSTRRQFLKGGVAAAAGFVILKRPGLASGYPANEALRIGCVGVGGRGADDLHGVAHEDVVALCDVDSIILGNAAKEEKFAKAAQFRDFRKMIDAGGLDAVVIGTPDHVHAPAAAYALRAGLHVYCEKPLCHEVFEVRTLTDLAREKKRVTQMGTQIHAEPNYRRVVERIQAGTIGDVTEVHVWVGNDYCGGERPTDEPPVPPNLDWDLWLGPAPARPYSPKYCPFWWRGWWDFGTGSLGDMACHHMDLPFWALGISHPTSVESEGPPPNRESTPPWMIVRYVMQKKDGTSVPLTWYHGGKRPHHFADGLLPQWGNGTLFVGKKGMLLSDYERHVLLPEKDFADSKPPPQTIPPSIGHHREWTEACKGNGTPLCNFDYAGPLTEAVLLGCVAFRSGKKIAWDPAQLSTGDAAADAFLKREYRAGWKL